MAEKALTQNSLKFHLSHREIGGAASSVAFEGRMCEGRYGMSGRRRGWW